MKVYVLQIEDVSWEFYDSSVSSLGGVYSSPELAAAAGEKLVDAIMDKIAPDPERYWTKYNVPFFYKVKEVELDSYYADSYLYKFV